ncbi:hypothetical protein NIASO_10505 [Niabella soli DSM 19437]|uniref:Uncharacterized protein n=1 Tax=Niabella soli DSM 19437 TaxID=929713 RepID=W0F3J2_9BACT|nr:hypothetical protein NIASO_10505 [Niabella soli DSM 19437]
MIIGEKRMVKKHKLTFDASLLTITYATLQLTEN